MRSIRHLVILIPFAVAACATAGGTFRSGVGDTFLEHPPYYAGASMAALAVDTTRIGHLPIMYQRGAAQESIFDPRSGPETPVGRLLAEMNAYLDSLTAASRLGVRLVEGGRVSAVTHAATVGPPDVHFGCIPASGAAGEECAARGDSVLGRSHQRMRLAVGRPAAAWVDWMREVERENGVGRALVITLEVGQYLPRQTGWLGGKEVELGTGYVARLPWLTSLETPVTVLQVTGALVDTTGRAIRIGAEGIAAVRTRLLVSAIGGQEILQDKDVEEARSLRRADLPGEPLAWRVALRQLVAQLTAREGIAFHSASR